MTTQSTYETDKKTMRDQKVIPFNTDKANLLFVEVPDCDCLTEYDREGCDPSTIKCWEFKNLKNQYENAGLLHEVPEEVAAKLVDERKIKEYDEKVSTFYLNYLYHPIQAAHIWKVAATESLRSLYRHLGFTDKQNVIVLYQLKNKK